MRSIFIALILVLLCSLYGWGQARLKQYPAISRSHVAFIYDNDVWVAPRGGGVATALTDAPGAKAKTRFSPDGGTLAFNANLEGNSEIYTVPITGGNPTRLTHLPTGENICQWTRDGRLLFYTNSLSFNNLAMQLFTIPATGGIPTRVGVPYGGEASLSDDGQWLAYTLNWPVGLMEYWKHYRGGMAHDIWLFNLRTKASRKITDWVGTDTMPMWRGEVVYYVSDAGPENRLNIWQYNIKTGLRKQLTQFAEYDVRYPSIGPGKRDQGEIIFQYGPELYLLDLGNGASTRVEIALPTTARELKPVTVDAAKFISGGGLSPTGDRVLLNARGDIWTVPIDGGSTQDLSKTSGIFERDPVWSPDGRWIAYSSDATGEYELYVTAPDASATRQLTHTGAGFKYRPVWSPDSARIAFVDQTNTVYVHTTDTGETRRIDTDEWGSQPQVTWSPDSARLAYDKAGENTRRSIWVYELGADVVHRVTSGMFDDNTPAFDRSGNYLYFLSTRNYTSPTLNGVSRTYVYTNEDTMVVMPLSRGVPSPLADRPRDVNGRIAIEFDGLEERSVRIPVEAWGLGSLGLTSEGNPIYVSFKLAGRRSVNIFDLKTKKEKTLFDGASSYELSADGRKASTSTGSTLNVADTAFDSTTAKQVALTGMSVEIDQRAEWRQLFNDVWRLYRDFFYDAKMHQIDWPLMRERYSKMLDACMTRDDVNFVLSEMVGELSVGHAYGGRGDLEQVPSVSAGMLGADFELQNGAYRITKIYTGFAWDINSRGPLSQPGVNVKVGDYLLAVNNKPVDIGQDPWAALVGLAGTDTRLTVSDRPVIDATARQVVIKPLATDIGLRYAAWIQSNRDYINKKTGGRVGYVHLPDFTNQALNSMASQFYGQVDKDALIIDIRWSQGGSLGDVVAKMLEPQVLNYLGGRYTKDRPIPQLAHHGPKCLLVSGMSVSAGENFAYYFRKLGVGKIIGNRTWGGLVGLNGNPALIDGGFYNIPNAPFFTDKGTWMVEGHGIEPDIDVVNDPSKMVAGVEPQLDAAIKQMLYELKVKPFIKARKPTLPRDRRRGMVLPAER